MQGVQSHFRHTHGLLKSLHAASLGESLEESWCLVCFDKVFATASFQPCSVPALPGATWGCVEGRPRLQLPPFRHPQVPIMPRESLLLPSMLGPCPRLALPSVATI